MDSGRNLLELLHRERSESPRSRGEAVLRLVKGFSGPPASALIRLALPGADVRYMRRFLSEEDGLRLFSALEAHRRAHGWTRMGGGGREIAQWSLPGGRRYIFSDTEFVAGEFPYFVLEVKRRIEERLNVVFNYCVANFYVDQHCGVSWHSDAEPELVDEAPIACVSVGSQRTLGLRHKRSLDETCIQLHHGSLFVMAGLTQTNYLHCILKDYMYSADEMPKTSVFRFSLTFRIHSS